MATYEIPGEHVYNGIVFSGGIQSAVLNRVSDFHFLKDDVLIATYPKTGTTWIQQIVWLIINNFDVEVSRKELLYARIPFLEHTLQGIQNINGLATIKSPRVIKTHLQSSFFKTSLDHASDLGFKTIVGMRNPKDVLVSFYYFYKISKGLGNFDGDFDQFFQLFQAKRLIYGDYFEHVLSWWQERENPNIYFVKYEDLKADPGKEITKLAWFLGKMLSETELTTIITESTFDSMKTNPMINYENFPIFDMRTSKFMRKGEVGDWRNYFNEEQRQLVDTRCVNELNTHGLTFQDTLG